MNDQKKKKKKKKLKRKLAQKVSAYPYNWHLQSRSLKLVSNCIVQWFLSSLVWKKLVSKMTVHKPQFKLFFIKSPQLGF